MRSFLPLLLVAGILVLLTGACSQQPDVEARPTAEATLASDLLVDASWLAEHFEDPSIVVLHVARDEAHFEEGHVPGAQFVQLGEIIETRNGELNALPPVDHLETVFSEAGVSDDHHVIIYGDLGGLSAARAFLTLDLLGHGQVSMLDGGLVAWKAAGHSVSTEASEREPGAFTATLHDDRLVDADWIAERLVDPALLLIDARPPAQYTGEVPGTDIERPGHIPGAASLFWQETLVSEENPVLRSPDELRAMHEEIGLSPDRTVVTYCRTGMQASFAYFVARYLGHEPRLYDPSFYHWSNYTDYPVATTSVQ